VLIGKICILGILFKIFHFYIQIISVYNLPSKQKLIEIDRNRFVLFVSNPDSDFLNLFLSN